MGSQIDIEHPEFEQFRSIFPIHETVEGQSQLMAVVNKCKHILRGMPRDGTSLSLIQVYDRYVKFRMSSNMPVMSHNDFGGCIGVLLRADALKLYEFGQMFRFARYEARKLELYCHTCNVTCHGNKDFEEHMESKNHIKRQQLPDETELYNHSRQILAMLTDSKALDWNILEFAVKTIKNMYRLTCTHQNVLEFIMEKVGAYQFQMMITNDNVIVAYEAVNLSHPSTYRHRFKELRRMLDRVDVDENDVIDWMKLNPNQMNVIHKCYEGFQSFIYRSKYPAHCIPKQTLKASLCTDLACLGKSMDRKMAYYKSLTKRELAGFKVPVHSLTKIYFNEFPKTPWRYQEAYSKAIPFFPKGFTLGSGNVVEGTIDKE